MTYQTLAKPIPVRILTSPYRDIQAGQRGEIVALGHAPSGVMLRVKAGGASRLFRPVEVHQVEERA